MIELSKHIYFLCVWCPYIKAHSFFPILLSQMQPHFIHNILNVIYYLCGKDPTAAQGAISKFSDHLRNNLEAISQKELITFRKELDLYDVPFLVGALGDFLKDREVSPQLVNYTHINAQLQLAAASDPLTGYVSAEGLDHKGDNLHFSAKSLFTFGERYFDLFQQLRDPNKMFEEKPNPDQAIRTGMEWM